MDNIRRGMWVKYKGSIGIVAATDDVVAEVHIVDNKGMTVVVVPGLPVSELEQAGFEDIPKERQPDKKLADAFGYK